MSLNEARAWRRGLIRPEAVPYPWLALIRELD